MIENAHVPHDLQLSSGKRSLPRGRPFVMNNTVHGRESQLVSPDPNDLAVDGLDWRVEQINEDLLPVAPAERMAAGCDVASSGARASCSHFVAGPVRDQKFLGFLSERDPCWPPKESLSGRVPVPDVARQIDRDKRYALDLELSAMAVQQCPPPVASGFTVADDELPHPQAEPSTSVPGVGLCSRFGDFFQHNNTAHEGVSFRLWSPCVLGPRRMNASPRNRGSRRLGSEYT